MTATQLYPALAQAADTAGILAQRDRGHLAAAATVTGERIRDLTPGSVTITVQRPPGHHRRQRHAARCPMTSRSPWSGLAAARRSGTSSPPPAGTPEADAADALAP